MLRTRLRKLTLLFLLLLALIWLLPVAVERYFNKVDAHEPYVVDEAARSLHESLYVADLHADSLLWRRNLLKRSSRGHLDIPRLQQGNVALQVFSATTQAPAGQSYDSNASDSADNITKLAVAQRWPFSTWNSIYERAAYQLEKLNTLASQSDGELVLIRTRNDLRQQIERRTNDEHVIAALFLIEGAHPLEGDLKNLDRLYAAGLRVLGLTHFTDNQLAGSLHGRSGAGLSDFGASVVRRADELGVTIDIAHASPQAVRDVLALSKRPLLLSHGGIKSHCDTARNLPDDIMLEFARAGGLIGIGFWDVAACGNTPQQVADAIRHAVDLLGIEHVALGSDFDGTITAGFDVSEIAAITQSLMNLGLTEQKIRAVMGENAKRFFLENLPD